MAYPARRAAGFWESTMSLPWFRMYAEFATDPVVQSLSFDDQRHFLMLLCFKCSGLLDREFATNQDRTDVIRKCIGLDGKAWDEMGARLYRVKLIDEFLQPLNWNKRQYISDADPTAAERQRKHRLKARHGPVTDLSRPSEAEADSDSDSEKAEEAAAFDTSECPRDMDTAAEHRTFCEWCGEKGKAPTVVRWRRWVNGAKQSGRYAKCKTRPPTEEEVRAERARIIAAQDAACHS
jgi:hypothetical protein